MKELQMAEMEAKFYKKQYDAILERIMAKAKV